jgi:hypothetical protein
MMQQRIHQRAVPVAAARMDDQPGRLVDDQQRLVLEDDVERDVFRLLRTTAGIDRLTDAQTLAAMQLAFGFALDAPSMAT